MDTSENVTSMGNSYTHGNNAGAPASAEMMPNGLITQPSGAAAAAQQPKVVQTAFIHKLYKSVTTFDGTSLF